MYRCLTSVQNASRINTGRTGRQTAREEHNARALFSERERVMQVKNKISVRLIWLLLAVILAVSCVSGCSGSGDAAEDEQMRDEVDFIGDAVADQGTTAEADDKFTLRYSKEEPLNPITCDGVYNDAITSLIYEGLFRLTDKFEPVNVLCKDYTTESGSTYTFNIIDAKMHDGSDLTAEDVSYSINRARLSSKFGSRLSNISYCTANDDNSIYVELYEADCSLPALLDIPIIKSGSVDSETPAGTGPYYFNSISGRPGLSVFKEHRNAENITLDRIHLSAFTDASVEESFANYTLDCIWQDTAGENPVNLYGDHEARYYGTSILQYVGFNADTPVLNDPNMRLAVSYAVNRQLIIDEIYNGKGTAAKMLLHPEYYLYSDAWDEGYGYSAAKISSCLAASGLDDKNSDGYLEYPVNGEHQYFELKLVAYDGNDRKLKAAESIVENLRGVGLKVTLEALPWESYKAALINGEFDLYYAEVAVTRNFDFCSFLAPDGTLDYGKIGSEEYSVVCKNFLNAVSVAEKTAAAQALCKTVAESAPIVPVMYRQYVVYTHRGVISNFSPTVSGVFGDAAEWTVKLD